MIPWVTPLGLFLLLAAMRKTSRMSGRYTLGTAAAWSMSALFLLTGAAHFSHLRDDMIRMVPPLFPAPALLVTLTGILELLGALGLLLASTRRLAGLCLALLLLAMLPANIYAAREGLMFGGEPATPLWLRVPEQLLYVVLALAPAMEAWTRRRSSALTQRAAT